MDTTDIPDSHLYQPLFSPWFDDGEFRQAFSIAAPRTLVSRDRCYVLYTLLRQAFSVEGDIWECGVYRGGTAAMLADVIAKHAPWKRLYLFDTFAGMPETNAERDWHVAGDFSDTSIDSVREYVGNANICIFRRGLIPWTFAGLRDNRIALAHVDVDIYKSVVDSMEFIWPRLSAGGAVIFDDYGFPTCPGARAAVDDFFRGRECFPLVLGTGQAIAFKSK